jgi:hypothetical protein
MFGLIRFSQHQTGPSQAVTKQNIVEYREIPHKRTGVVKRRVKQVVEYRKVHQARIHGSQEEFTVVVYHSLPRELY